MNTQSPPKPSRLLIASSVAVICGSVLLASAGLAAAWSADPLGWLLTIICIPIALFVGIHQYRGTFRLQSGGAAITSGLLLVGGVLACLVYIMNVGESLVESTLLSTLEFALWFSPMLVFGGICLFVGWQNRIWSKVLLLAERNVSSDATGQRARFTLREVFLVMSVICVCAALAALMHREQLPPYAEHVSSEQAPLNLPPAATDVCYARGFRGTIAMEFTTDEQSFRDWVETRLISSEARRAGHFIEPITEFTTINRYTRFLPHSSGLDEAEIEDGLSYSWSRGDSGMYAVFDRTTGRAYFFTHNH